MSKKTHVKEDTCQRRHLSKKTPVKMLHGLVQASCHVFTVFDDSEASSKCFVGSVTPMDDNTYTYIYI